MSQPNSSAEISALYQELILDHYRRPRNKGTLEKPDASVEMKNPLCGDEIGLQVEFDGNAVHVGNAHTVSPAIGVRVLVWAPNSPPSTYPD